jgi:hypothetical protein
MVIFEFGIMVRLNESVIAGHLFPIWSLQDLNHVIGVSSISIPSLRGFTH